MVQKFDSISALFEHAERQTQSTILVGTVKPCEADEQYFDFSPSNCGDWLKIPRDGVDDIEYLGRVACQKRSEEPHSHPLVRLKLTQRCVAEFPYLKSVSELIKLKQSALRRFAARENYARHSPVLSRLARGMPCFEVDIEGEIFICCCDDKGDNCECGGIV
jgi:hypothetical protein